MTGVTKFSAKSHLELSQTCFDWEVKNFNRICPNPKVCTIPDDQKQAFFKSHEAQLTSPKFDCVLETFANGTIQTKLHAKMYLYVRFTAANNCSEINSKENNLSIYLTADEVANLSDDASIFYEFAIIGRNNQVLRTRSARFTNSDLKELSCWGWQNFVSVKALWDENGIVDGNLQLRVTLDCVASVVTTVCHRYPDLDSPSQALTRSVDFSSTILELLDTGMDSDLKINVNGRIFKCHSLILKSRSPVFRRMLESPMSEGLTNSIEILDVEEQDFHLFLKFIYGGRTEELRHLGVNGLMELASLGEKYEVDTLKMYCFYQLLNRLSVENAAQIAVCAFRQNASMDVRTRLLSFCSENWSVLNKNLDFRNSVEQVPGAFLANINRNN